MWILCIILLYTHTLCVLRSLGLSESIMEAVVTVIAIFAGLAGILTYWQKYVRDPEDTRQYLSHVFESARRRNADLLHELKTYSDSNDLRDAHFMQGFSFDDAIRTLELCERELFSAEHARAISRARTSRNTEALISSLQRHDQHVVESRNYFRQHFLGQMVPDGT